MLSLWQAASVRRRKSQAAIERAAGLCQQLLLLLRVQSAAVMKSKRTTALSVLFSAGRAVGLMTYILHELLADGADVLGEGGREHHHLLLVGGVAEYLLHVPSHVCNTERKVFKNQVVLLNLNQQINFADLHLYYFDGSGS